MITTWHHVVLGGWSLGLLANKEIALVRRLSCGSYPLSLTPRYSLRSFYAWMSGQDQHAAKEKAKQLFNGYYEVKYPWDSITDGAASELTRTSIVLLTSAFHTAILQSLASARGVTIATILRELSARCLMKLSDTSDVVFGEISSGRNAAAAEVEGIENMVGMFVNTVGCRAVHGSGRISSFSVSADWVPLASLPQHAARHASRLLHVVQNANVESDDSEDFWINLSGRGELTQDFGLTWTPGREASVAVSGYASIILSSLVSVMQFYATARHRPKEVPRSLPMYGRAVALASEFIPQLSSLVDAVSVVDDVHHISHRTLIAHTRANAMLRRVSLVVGVQMNRSIESVVLAASLLTTGMTYVPIGTSLPHNRVISMIEDAGIGLVVGSSSHACDLGVPTVVPLSRPVESAEPACSAFVSASSYVLYTSGSSGKPKGVRVGSFSLWNHMEWLCTGDRKVNNCDGSSHVLVV